MKTFYRPEMNVQGNTSFSPSAGKPKKFIEFLLKHNLPLNIEDGYLPVSRQDLSMAHDEMMVNGILDLKLENGFGNRLPEVAKSLPFTSGSFYAASEWAIKSKENAFSPTSGFHHASFKRVAGFCTFNGLLVSALKLKSKGLVQKIGIVDIDNHYGDGTENIINHLRLNWIKHYTFGAEGIGASNAEEWLSGLEKKLKAFKDVDIIFYQAGGDVHISDSLGGVLTSEQMKRRDELVFSTFKKLGIPVVWNMAGGYQDPLEKVLELHKTTYEIALHYSANV